MTDTATVAVFTAASSFAVALIAGGIALHNRRKTDANSVAINDLKGAVDRDLERLRAKLSHGQVINSTQWNAEFSSYQAIWKGMVGVRTIATKLVLREGELVKLGLEEDYLASPRRVEIFKENLEKFVAAAQLLLYSIHENAPFYPEAIRNAADDTHSEAKALFDKYLGALASFAKGVDITQDADFTDWNRNALQRVIGGVDITETLIRERLSAVQVMNLMQG